MPTPLHVLIVEDIAIDAELMARHLQKDGFQLDWQRVETEADYRVALETHYDLILSDWSLPQFSGLRALQLLQESGLNTPFIIVSGNIGEEAAVNALHQGAYDYVLKDRPDRLGQSVRNALQQKELLDERKKADEQLRRNLEEKEVLLREVHHRVKNNLSVIASLLNLQSSVIQTPEEALTAFRNSRDRVISMALVHEELYRSRDYARIDMNTYLGNLTRQILSVYDTGGNIRLSAQAEGIVLNVNTAVPCGLILNELITNAVKHAFPTGGPGDIHIVLRAVDDDCIELSVSDNGIGMPEGFEWQQCGSMGLTLVRLLTEQIRGTLEIFGENGTHCRIRFPKKGEA